MVDYKDPDSLPPVERSIYFILRDTFRNICAVDNWDSMEVNGFVIGMCRASMEDILGREGAIAADRDMRKGIGWTPTQTGQETNPVEIDRILDAAKHGVYDSDDIPDLIAEVEELRERMTALGEDNARRIRRVIDAEARVVELAGALGGLLHWQEKGRLPRMSSCWKEARAVLAKLDALNEPALEPKT